jgi:hypothetical protein
VALALAGAVLLVYGWWRISGESRLNAQLPYLASASLPGAALVVSGAVVLARALRPSSDPRVDALLQLLTEPTANSGAANSVELTSAELVTVLGTSHFHRPDCVLVAGKPVSPYSSDRDVALTACPVCLPPA